MVSRSLAFFFLPTHADHKHTIRSDLSIAEREDYISAVQCLQRLPPKTPSSVSPGARSRFDDFLTVHIQQTPSIHNTANFLGWHRYYVWQYEKALREECGYKGFQPYWNWNREVADPTKSAMFNGNATSLSGNSPSSGACVTSGPFKDMAVNLGPGASLKYNPRCLKRDISASQAQACTADKTLSLIKNSPTIGRFQDTMQGIPGVHAGGHFTIGGDPGSVCFFFLLSFHLCVFICSGACFANFFGSSSTRTSTPLPETLPSTSTTP